MAVNTTAPQQQTQPNRLSNATAFGVRSPLASVGSGGTEFEKLYGAIQSRVKMLNENAGEQKYAAIKLLKNNTGLNYAGIVVAEVVENSASAHILMVERTGDYPEPLMENIGGTRYEIIRTPADALDEIYVNEALKVIAGALKLAESAISIVDGTLVPSEFDVNNSAQIDDLLYNTFNSIVSENAVAVTDYKGINITNFIKNNPNGKFTIDLYYSGGQSDMLDQTGMPIRQDVCISLSYKVLRSGQTSKSVNQGNDVFNLVKTYGYIDYEYQGPKVINAPFPMMGTQKFAPNFIITHIESEVAPTCDILALAVASVFSLNEDMNWVQAFRSIPQKKGEIDYNDIGALNIEGNIENNGDGYGKKVQTKSKNFDLVDFTSFVQKLVYPYLMISIDVPKAGPMTWFTSIFNYIAQKNSVNALNRFNDSIVNLTNGFYTPAPTKMFLDASNKIHGGYYRDKGDFRDLRHISSYLTVANHISELGLPGTYMTQYTNTLSNGAIGDQLRAAGRKQYIDEISKNTAVVKQFYDRYTFTASFLNAMVQALRSAGFNPTYSNQGNNNDMFVRRMTTDFSQAMLNADSRLMNMGGGYVNNPYNPNAWNRY